MAKRKKPKCNYMLHTKDGDFTFMNEAVMNIFISHLNLKDYKISIIHAKDIKTA